MEIRHLFQIILDTSEKIYKMNTKETVESGFADHDVVSATNLTDIEVYKHFSMEN